MELAGPGAEGARGARCGDGQHRGAEDQAGVQGGAEERRGQSLSPLPLRSAAAALPRVSVGRRGRCGRPAGLGGEPALPSAPPPRVGGGPVPRPLGGEWRFLGRRGPPAVGRRRRRGPQEAQRQGPKRLGRPAPGSPCSGAPPGRSHGAGGAGLGSAGTPGTRPPASGTGSEG